VAQRRPWEVEDPVRSTSSRSTSRSNGSGDRHSHVTWGDLLGVLSSPCSNHPRNQPGCFPGLRNQCHLAGAAMTERTLLARLRLLARPEDLPINVRLSYQGGVLGAHMHDSRATKPSEVDTMVGKWLGVLLSTSDRQIRLSGRTDAEVDCVPGAKEHDL
jgi:hypothetical protein